MSARTTLRGEFALLERQQVRWGDMDALGHVNNAVYFVYCESARMRLFEALRLRELAEAPTHGPALASATCNFRQQVHYPAELEVGVRVAEVKNRSFVLEYAAFRAGTDEVVADGSSAVVWVDYAAGGAIPLPPGLRAALEARRAGTA